MCIFLKVYFRSISGVEKETLLFEETSRKNKQKSSNDINLNPQTNPIKEKIISETKKFFFRLLQFLISFSDQPLYCSALQRQFKCRLITLKNGSITF